MKILVTGGCGFIGSNFIRYLLKAYPEYSVINVDKLTYAGNLENLSDLSQSPRYHFLRGDIADASQMEELIVKGVDAIVNFAAESHVDRSIEDPTAFMKTNVFGTFVLLEAVRKAFPKQRIPFLHVSTDEVYGSLGESGAFTEETPLAPNSPYSASKTAADMMVRAYYQTYGLPATHHPMFEQLWTVSISREVDSSDDLQRDGGQRTSDLRRRTEYSGLDLCGRSLSGAGCRSCTVAEKGRSTMSGGGVKRRISLSPRRFWTTLGNLIPCSDSLPIGQAMTGGMPSIFPRSSENLGWRPSVSFEEGIRRTVEWYQTYRQWWRKIKTGEYLDYYKRMYDNGEQEYRNPNSTRNKFEWPTSDLVV